jgi:DNA-binding NtrC family response regulator
VVLSPGHEIHALDLPIAAAPAPSGGFSIGVATLDEVEKAYVEWVVSQHSGNRSAAARALGIARNTLHRKLGEPDL